MASQKKDGSFECLKCGRTYERESSLKRHTKDVHEARFRCDRCSYQTGRRTEIQKHYAKHADLVVPPRNYSLTPVKPSYKPAASKFLPPRSRSRSKSSPSPSRVRSRSPCRSRSPRRSRTPSTPVRDEPRPRTATGRRSPSPLDLSNSGASEYLPRTPVSTRRPPSSPKARSCDASTQTGATPDIGQQKVKEKLDQARCGGLQAIDNIVQTFRIPPGMTITRTTERYITKEGEVIESVKEELTRVK